MVNTEEFTQRLHTIMKYYELSAAAFADRIDVGRSSISHLLSGRNKPSLEFVLKITEAFPEVELYWLLNGKGSFPKKEKQVDTAPQKAASVPAAQPDLFNVPENLAPPGEPGVKSKYRKIHRIVLFYEDGTFEAFEN